MSTLGRVVLLAGVVAVVVYGLLVGWLVINEDRLVYFPERGPVPLPRGIGVSPVSIDAPDGVRLSTWLLVPMSDTAHFVLILHGNAGNIATPGRPEHDQQFRRMGLGVFALDYRGYGDSEGTPSEPGLYADALAAYRYLTDIRKVPPGRVIIYGHSLGSAVAVELATKVPAAGLIIEGAFTSVPDRGAELYPFIPVRLIARNRYNSLERIPSLRMPLLVIHGRNDSTIPMAHGRRLFEAAPEPKTFLEVAGGHDDAYIASEYEEGIRRFLHTIP